MALEAEICLPSKFTHTQICLCTYADVFVCAYIHTHTDKQATEKENYMISLP